MNRETLLRRGALTLVISAAFAAASLAPARAADTPCTAQAKPATQAQGQGSSTAPADQKGVPDGFGRLVTPGYGTTVPGTPSELAAEKKKGDQTANANANDKAPDSSCK